MPRTVQCRSWVFTLNNPTDEAAGTLLELSEQADVDYIVYGREVAPTTGTVHLQGFISFARRRSFSVVRDALPVGCHVEVARHPRQAAEYCKKEGDYTEYGTFPSDVGQGRRTDLERFVEWVRTLDGYPSQRTLCRLWPSVYARFHATLPAIITANLPEQHPVDGELRGWQGELVDVLDGEPDDRHVLFYVDHDGGAGKSWFCRWAVARYECQVLRVGKRDDIAHMIDVSKRVFLFDVPRSQMEFLQYSVLEMLKDMMISSPKYNSVMKTLMHVPHVVVFCNEEPKYDALSADRYQVTNI